MLQVPISEPDPFMNCSGVDAEVEVSIAQWTLGINPRKAGKQHARALETKVYLQFQIQGYEAG